MQREAQRVGGDGAHLAVVRRIIGVGGIDVDLLEVRGTSRIVHHFDQVVLVLTRLDTKLDVTLHGAG